MRMKIYLKSPINADIIFKNKLRIINNIRYKIEENKPICLLKIMVFYLSRCEILKFNKAILNETQSKIIIA